MYSIEIFIKNRDNPYYKEVLKAQSDKIFKEINELLDSKASIGMKDSFAEQMGSFVTMSGLPEDMNIKRIVEMLNVYEQTFKDKFNITQFTYRIFLTPIDPKE